MKRFKEHPISTFIGLLFILMAFALLFIETRYDLPLLALGIMAVSGILLLFSKDEFISILTLGFATLVKKKTEEKRE